MPDDDKKSRPRLSFSHEPTVKEPVKKATKSHSFQFKIKASFLSNLKEKQVSIHEEDEDQEIKFSGSYEHKFLGILKYQIDNINIENLRSLKK